jgi:hypothetical protein
MMQINYWAVFAAALVPIIMGFIWYHPKVFGKAWMKEVGLTEEKMKGSMIGVFIFSIMLSALMALFLQFVTIHQFGALGMVGGDEMNANPSYHAFMKDYVEQMKAKEPKVDGKVDEAPEIVEDFEEVSNKKN